jgi:alginate O-acetyltransferase complex protein AlgI
MLFNSWSFVIFLPLVLALHYAGRRAGWQVGVLTLASFAFYGWGVDGHGHPHWKLVPLLALSTLLNGFAAQELLSPRSSLRRRRWVLALALGFNLGALAFFKYAALLGRLCLPASLWQAWGPRLDHIPLPIGISFYTFQGVSLVMESWWAGAAGLAGLPAPSTWPERRWFHAKVWFFKAFFPQLVAGPIVKAGEFLHQIGAKRFADIDWNGAVKKLVLGFFLKMVVADNLKDATAGLHFPEFTELPRLNLLALLYGFSFQILADFGGYSLIAQGLAKLFGYELPINFDFPYLSRSVTEFWRRWHISLSSWLRQYLYIPLGGNRRGELRTYINLFLVMFLGGLWHGAAWSYAVWGTAHGLLLAGERVLFRRSRAPERPGWTLPGVLRALIVFSVVSALWLLFKLPHFGEVIAYARCLATNPGGVQWQSLYVIGLFSLPVVAWHLWAALSDVRARWNLARHRRLETVFYGLMLWLIFVNSGSAGEFIYFQF